MLALTPKQTYDLFVGEVKFTFRYMTGREFIGMAKSFDDMNAATSLGSQMETVFEVVRTTLVGWGLEVEFDAAKLEDYITIDTASKLLEGIMDKNSISESEEGKS